MGQSEVCIVSAAIGGNYRAGQRRLERSLKAFSYMGAVQLWEQWPEAHHMDEGNNYNIKAATLARAILRRHRILIWMDCTCVATAPLDPLVERIKERGYYLASSGYSAGQTCTDRQLEAAGITRDAAMDIPDTATGTIGIDLTDERATAFLREWIEWARRGLFAGNRMHDIADSADPRFLFGRQDQAAASLLAHKHGMSLDALGGLTAYWPGPPTTVVAYKGIG